MRYLWERYYYVQRAYASKGVFDILAIPPKHRHCSSLLIQAKGDKKQGYINPKERKQLGVAAKSYDGICCIAFKTKTGKLRFRLIPIWW